MGKCSKIVTCFWYFDTFPRIFSLKNYGTIWSYFHNICVMIAYFWNWIEHQIISTIHVTWSFNRCMILKDTFIVGPKIRKKYIDKPALFILCLVTGLKMFCAGPNFLSNPKNSFTECGSHKHFVPEKKMIRIQ